MVEQNAFADFTWNVTLQRLCNTMWFLAIRNITFERRLKCEEFYKFTIMFL